MSLRTQSSNPRESCSKSGAKVLCGQVRKGILGTGILLVSIAVLMVAACGGSSSSTLPATPTTGNGVLYTFVTDTPACDVLGFSVYFSQMYLHKANRPPTGLVTVWPTNASQVSPTIDMSSLRETMAIANLTSIPAGTYDQIILTVLSNGASIYDPTKDPPLSSYSPTINTENLTINLQPPLTITIGKVSAIRLDVNLPQTLGVDSQGQLSGKINWAITAQPLVASGSTGFGELDNLHGIVRSVNPSSTNSNFTGSFVLQTLPQTLTTGTGGGPALTVDLTDSTDLCMAGDCQVPVSQINQMPTGSYVEVDGYVDENGNLIAKAVQVEDREFVNQQLLAYEGLVLQATKDSAGNVTQFEMMVIQTDPSAVAVVPHYSTVTVHISPSTTFNPYLVSSDLENLASSGNLALNDTTIAPGEEVVVHGVYSKPAGGPVSVEANSIYPRPQSIQGTFSSLVGSPGSDNKTGAFQLGPCLGLLSNNPFMVVTDAQTNFVNTSGLSTLSTTSPLMVRGLAFLNLQNTTIAGTGTSVPAGTMVVLAKQVHQF